MELQPCTDCPGVTCFQYQKQHNRERTLSLRGYVDALTVQQAVFDVQDVMHDLLRRGLTKSPLVLDTDVFTVHVLPADDGGTEYHAVLANRTIAEPSPAE